MPEGNINLKDANFASGGVCYMCLRGANQCWYDWYLANWYQQLQDRA